MVNAEKNIIVKNSGVEAQDDLMKERARDLELRELLSGQPYGIEIDTVINDPNKYELVGKFNKSEIAVKAVWEGKNGKSDETIILNKGGIKITDGREVSENAPKTIAQIAMLSAHSGSLLDEIVLERKNAWVEGSKLKNEKIKRNYPLNNLKVFNTVMDEAQKLDLKRYGSMNLLEIGRDLIEQQKKKPTGRTGKIIYHKI